MELELHEQIFQFASPDDSPGFLLWQVSNLWQRKMKAGLSGLGLTHVQFVLLAGIVWLNQKGESVTQAALAAHAKTDVMMTSKVLRTLEQKGLVKRETLATDTRAKSLTTTSQGYQLFKEAIRIVDRIDNEFFEVSGCQLKNLNECLQAVLALNQSSSEFELLHTS
jgi:DNA-binding MarR family transcriptional regulator